MRERFTALAEAAAQVASPQLRNQGTLGGNVCQKPRCWYYRGDFACLRKGGELCFAYTGENEFHAVAGGGPCYIVHPSDTAPALAALGAIAHVVGPKGSRTVPLDRFFVLPAAGPEARDGARAGRDPDEAAAAEAGGRPAQHLPQGALARVVRLRARRRGDRPADAGRSRRPRARRLQRRRPGAVAGAGGREGARGPPSRPRDDRDRRRPPPSRSSSRSRRTPTRSPCCAGSCRNAWRRSPGPDRREAECQYFVDTFDGRFRDDAPAKNV